jgi:2-oxoglutarate ferredoxin oxidoreductase subunit delta
MSEQRLIIDQERCKGCGLCIAVCPHHVLQFGNQPNRHGQLPVAPSKDREDLCTSCARCARSCPDVAISVFRPDAPKKEPSRP